MPFVFTGISDSDLLVSLNFIVFPNIDFVLNLLLPLLFWSEPPTVSSSIFVAPIMLFLYSDRTSFLCFSNFFVRFNSGSNKPFFYAHFFYNPWSLLIYISWRLFFFFSTSNYFFIFIISLFSIYSSFC